MKRGDFLGFASVVVPLIFVGFMSGVLGVVVALKAYDTGVLFGAANCAAGSDAPGATVVYCRWPGQEAGQ